MKIIGYARTTIINDDLDIQIARLTDFRCDEIFHESCTETPSQTSLADLPTVLSTLEKGDTLVICQLHRLGKSTRQLTELMQQFKQLGIHLVSLQEEIDTRTASGKAYFQLMDGLAMMECSLIKERTLVGLNEARKRGNIGGRPKIDGRTVKRIRRMYFDQKEKIQQISNKCGVSIGTCYKYINLSESDVQKFLEK
ncbi:resolvase [Enterococcus phoeniculicola]|jgi:DNA invertase Pin-like site-specific DNA recombinase|uniref:Resolvase n=1 Tax=Enterococcus phoeniculicola ATCC BAA-412 TaxID=1158610 RepID=R3WU61_9ENTE|nr:recombinase family protein [Enterococcus phoeniculicola]EOL45350.1 resolvase [Enterococcus phoeniculicola ATCC BAA-412]EOT74712.1 resolvase [Enterococcus phoeniculicola ATCC BAA-412]OJG73852.1 resolvase [Enterococcus phoeniculicola]